MVAPSASHSSVTVSTIRHNHFLKGNCNGIAWLYTISRLQLMKHCQHESDTKHLHLVQARPHDDYYHLVYTVYQIVLCGMAGLLS